LPIATGPVTVTTQAGLAYIPGVRTRLVSNSDPTQWIEGPCTAYSGTTLSLNVDTTSATAAAALSVVQTVPQCGRLVIGGASPNSTLKFAPYMGDRIKINGNIYLIPAAGIVGLSTTSVFVNGVAGQNLVNNTFYYVYCFSNAGVLTADFSTTGHVTSATVNNVGTEIKSGDDTRSLIGVIQTAGSTQFYDQNSNRYVRSWFNRQAAPLYNSGGVGVGTSFICLGSEAVQFVIGFNFSAGPSVPAGWYPTFNLDGSIIAQFTLSIPTYGYFYTATIPWSGTIAEGAVHTVTGTVVDNTGGSTTVYVSGRVG
jgi:hypothetical protein